MRRLYRPALPAPAEQYLASQQAALEDGANVEEVWKHQRRSARMREIEQALRAITGLRERCMYCEDSRGTDIEHFWPRIRYRDRVFAWPNLLWACAGCNRCKGKRLPLDASGTPLLIDPTTEDPWQHFFYDGRTREVTARWDVDTGQENVKAQTTLKIIATLRHQAVTDGRGRVQRNLQRAARAFLAHAPGEEQSAFSEFWEALQDNDGYGLVQWFLLREGREERPFSTVREKKPDSWALVVSWLRAAET